MVAGIAGWTPGPDRRSCPGLDCAPSRRGAIAMTCMGPEGRQCRHQQRCQVRRLEGCQCQAGDRDESPGPGQYQQCTRDQGQGDEGQGMASSPEGECRRQQPGCEPRRMTLSVAASCRPKVRPSPASAAVGYVALWLGQGRALAALSQVGQDGQARLTQPRARMVGRQRGRILVAPHAAPSVRRASMSAWNCARNSTRPAPGSLRRACRNAKPARASAVPGTSSSIQ